MLAIEDEVYFLLGYYAMQSGRCLLMFRRKMLDISCLVIACYAYFPKINMAAVYSSVSLLTIYQTTRRQVLDSSTYQYRDQWRAVVNTVKNLCATQNIGKILRD
jgi:hypothetical protein